jgi:hypothetical protein
MSPLHAAGSRRRLHFGKCACKRQLVPSRTSAGLGEQKANQTVCGPLRSLVISLRHCQTSVMAIPRKSPVPRNGPRSTPPGSVGACISENARASGNSYLHGHRRVSGSRRQPKPFAARLGRPKVRARFRHRSSMSRQTRRPRPRWRSSPAAAFGVSRAGPGARSFSGGGRTPDRESQVRSRLAGGGSGLRTLGPPLW